jgi:hypothetical protein
MIEDEPGDSLAPWGSRAGGLIGRHLLVGVTVLGPGDEVIEQREFHGLIELAEEGRGIAIRRHDTGTLEWLPPDLDALRPAPPGRYTLSSSGDVVVDPDLLGTWTVVSNR